MTTTYRNTPGGILAVRGKRELHVLTTSVEATEKARTLLATHSFDRPFKAGRSAPHTGRNVRYLKVATGATA